VTDTVDVLVTAITDGIVALIPAGREEGLGNQVELRALQSRDEGVLWVMTVPQGNVARNAEVEVLQVTQVTNLSSDHSATRG